MIVSETAFANIYQTYDFNNISSQIYKTTRSEVRRILDYSDLNLTTVDFKALLSPAAEEFLEEIAQRAQMITRKRFGNVMQLYAPLYLSNECRSTCLYCGFNRQNKIKRVTLSIDEAVREAGYLFDKGIRHILLLTGEDYINTPVEYIGSVASALSKRFPSIGIEVYPLEENDYSYLRKCGVDSLAIYQETYDAIKYKQVHPQGVKKKMVYRLNCPDRAGRAGIRRICIGALLGLSDPVAEIFFLALHARYLMKKYWQTQISISLPRLRPAAGFDKVTNIPDKIFVRFLMALRIFLPDVGLILSTRESPSLRNSLSDICITTMSAGSRTDPGGYLQRGATEQFSIVDNRSIEEICSMLESSGKEAVFTDWNPIMK